jgi:hypothetical protein
MVVIRGLEEVFIHQKLKKMLKIGAVSPNRVLSVLSSSYLL